MPLQFVRTVNAWLSDFILILFPLAVGGFFSVQTRFIQIRAFREGLRRLLSVRGNPKERAALVGTLGAGNLVGVSGAILHGGPGAVFWLWVFSFFGMAAAYAEAVLSVRTHSEIRDGHFRGGPVHYIAKAFGEGIYPLTCGTEKGKNVCIDSRKDKRMLRHAAACQPRPEGKSYAVPHE